MDLKKIISAADHTNLKQTATWQDIKQLCDDAVKYGTASVCIPPDYVKRAKQYTGGKMRICTVIGFPNGYSTTAVKVFETRDAIQNGADEIDMVININRLKDGDTGFVLSEINQVKAACGGKILKVIIETCCLTDDEKIEMCQIVSQSNADYIKTSTGFGTAGATEYDVALFAKHTYNTKIKAAGGISTLEDAEKFLSLGADRLGTSRIIKLVKELN